MKTWVKIVAIKKTGLMLLLGVSANLYAQQKEPLPNQYYVEIRRNSLHVGKSGGGCGDDYHALEFEVKDINGDIQNSVEGIASAGGKGKSNRDFADILKYKSFSVMPKTITLIGKAGDESYRCAEDKDVWSYQKGEGSKIVEVSPYYSTCGLLYCCNRSLEAKYTVIVDDPASVTYNQSKAKSNTFATATEKLILNVGPFYRNGNKAELQISTDNKNWKTISPDVRPNESITLSYEDIITLSGVDFEAWLGQTLYFRVLKTLLNGTKTWANDTGAIIFYPDGMKFSITSTKQMYCDNDVKLTVHLENPDDAKYMALHPDNYRWVMALDSVGKEAFYCTMVSLGDNKFQIEPEIPEEGRDSPFIATEDVFWYLQLQDQTKKDRYFCVRQFTIPAKPEKITVAQMPPGYTINGVDYHVPHTNSKFAMLNITDPSYDSHYRVPYTVDIGNGHEVTIPELGASAFEDLTLAEQDTWEARFDIEYAAMLENDNILANFAKTQWGEVLPERVERIAMPKDGSFFLYTQKINSTTYRLHKATFTFGREIKTTPLVPSESVIDIEITPDGAYCIYKKYNMKGLFVLPLTGTIPSSGTLLSNKSESITDDMFDQELPNHIYRNVDGNWEYISMAMGYVYSITIPNGQEKIIDLSTNFPHSSSLIFVSESGKMIWSQPNQAGFSARNLLTGNVVDLYDLPAPPCSDMIFNINVPINSDKCSTFSLPSTVNSDNVKISISCQDYNCTSYGCSKMMTIRETSCYSLDNVNILDISPDGEEIIVASQFHAVRYTPELDLSGFTQQVNTVTQYYNIFSADISTRWYIGSNLKISPNHQYIIFSNNNNVYKSSTNNLLISNKTATNICFSGHGKYFLFVDPVTGFVYKQYMSEQDAIDDTEPLFRENAWKQFLNKNIGTKVGSKHIQLNTAQTWTLKDADGCVYDSFPVFIKAPENPSMTYTIVKKPSSACAQDGIITITYRGGGPAPFLYQSNILQQIGDQITVSSLGYGDNKIQFTDEFGNESYLFPVTIGGSAEISNVVVTNNTCASPNGKIQISVVNLSGDKIYELKNTAYPFRSYTYTTANNTHEFTGMPSGVYTVSVSRGDCHFGRAEEYEIEPHIFNITDIAVTPATTLEGKGSATFTFAELSGTAEWLTGDALFDSKYINQAVVTTQSGGVEPGMYALTVRSNTGCEVEANITVNKPAYSGKINLNYTKDSLRIATEYLVENELFEPYKFRIIDASDAIITEDKKPDIVIRQPGNYALYAHHTQSDDAMLLYEFRFPVDSIKADVNVAPPVCPQDMGTVTVNVKGGGFLDDLSAVKMSVDGLNYNKLPQTMNLEASAYNAWLRDTMVTQKDNLNIHAVLLQPHPFVVPAVEPISAQIDYEAPSCANSADGKIQLSNFTGGSGEYEYRINDNTWKDTTVAIAGLGPGTYNVYLRDKKYQCETQHLHSVKLCAPDTLKVNIVSAKQPTCELDNGSLMATLQGGDGYYRYDWYRDDNLMGSADYDAISEIIFGDTLSSGFYKLQVYDGKQCVVSDTVTLHTYHNPRVETVKITDVSCIGTKDGTVELLTTSGTTPIDSVILKHLYLPYTYSNTGELFNQLDTGKYALTLRDTLSCYSTTPHSLFVSEPDPLRIMVDTILPVVEKGSRSGKIIFKIYDGNAGPKIIWLKQADGVVVDSLMYINNVIPLSFTQYAGLYHIEVEDSKGCREATGTLQIEEPDSPLELVIKEVKDARCKSQVGSITVEGVGGWGGYRYKRENETNFTTLHTFDNLYPGHYVITVTDKLGATYSETIMVHEPKDSLKAEVISRQLPTCGNNGAFSIQLSGGTPPYKLYENTDTVFCNQPQTVAWPGKESGNYLLHLIDNNECRFELEENLPATALLAIEKMEVKYPVLPAAPDGEIKVMIQGGVEPYTYQWAQNVTTALAVNSPELSGIPAGHYGVKVTDAGGCTIHEEVMLTDPSYEPFTILGLGHETSFEAANGYAVLYAEASLSDYTLITPENTIMPYASSDATDRFRVQNDTIYLYGLSGGKWVIVGTNSTGYHAVSEFSINVYNKFTINNIAISPVRKKGLFDGQVRIDVQGGGGGNSYTWTTSSGTPLPSEDYESGSILRDVPAGAYTVKVEDCYGNILQKEIVVEEPEQALTVNVADYQNQSCKTSQDAYVVLSASGGWGDYQFRHASERYFGNGTIYRNLQVAEHYFYVIDRQGVIDSLFIDITEPEYVNASATLIVPVMCKDAVDGGALFSVSGGTAPYSLSRLDSGIWNKGTVANGLLAGYHTFVFKDENNCVGQDTVTVYVPEPDSLLVENIKVTHTTCAEDNGKIVVSMQGGTAPYQYQWTDLGNTVIGAGAEISGLAQNGRYRLTVTDYNGCTQHLEQLIQPSTSPVITSLQTTPVLCYGDTTGSAQAVVIPAKPYAAYSLTWSNGNQGASSSRFYKGTHYVTVTDANGCTATRYFDIEQPGALILFDTEVRNPHCYGYNDGRILTGTLGGTPDYAYQWSNGATTPDVENLAKGDYQVIVTDANGCVYEKSFTLEEPDAQTVDLGEDVVICPGNTHLLDGKNYVAYRWYTAAGDISNEQYLYVREAGRYFLEATDTRGCPALGEVNVAIGNNALIADFLLPSEAALGDTIMVFELSNMALDSLKWDYDHTAFERIFWNNDYDYSYMLSLLSVQPGVHNIDLYAYSGGCYSRASKSVDIGAQRAPAAVPAMENATPLITSVKLYPNPNNAVFAVEVKLRETADVRLVLFSVVPGARVDDRTERGLDYYHVTYNLPQLGTGMYVMMVMAGSERQLVKLIVAR